jgi:hypothetical protein
VDSSEPVMTFWDAPEFTAEGLSGQLSLVRDLVTTYQSGKYNSEVEVLPCWLGAV